MDQTDQLHKQYAQYERTNYTSNAFKVGEFDFVLEKRYNPIQQGKDINKIQSLLVGSGAYGIVLQVVDLKSDVDNNTLAVKKIEKPFQHRFYAKRALRELKILRNLKHENVNFIIFFIYYQIVDLRTIQLPKSREEIQDVYLVTELLDTDLRRILEKEHSCLDEDHFKLFFYQILRGIKYMHSANILHRDLKPRNLLLNKKDCMLKICDFGLSRALLSEGIKGKNPNIMTDYIETRYYRAPELLLGLKTYTKAVDMWSVGCIFAEIVRGTTLWRGQTSENQLRLIFDVLGTPTPQKIASIPDQYVQNKLKEVVSIIGFKQHVPLKDVLKNLSDEALDLIEKLLELDYTKRLSAEEALKHPYFTQLHYEEDEPTRTPVSDAEFEFELYEFTTEQLKDMIYEEILLYHFPEFKKTYDEKVSKNESVISHIREGQNAKIIDSDADDDYLG